MAKKLPEFIQSHEQVGLYIMQIDRYRSYLLQDKAGSAGDGGKISPKLKDYLQQNSDTGEITQDSLESMHALLKKVRKKAPRFNVTFASFAGYKLKKDLINWFRENIHGHTLVSFHYDRSIAGGMIVRGRNNIFNFSFAPKLEEPQRPLTAIINEQS